MHFFIMSCTIMYITLWFRKNNYWKKKFFGGSLDSTGVLSFSSSWRICSKPPDYPKWDSLSGLLSLGPHIFLFLGLLPRFGEAYPRGAFWERGQGMKVLNNLTCMKLLIPSSCLIDGYRIWLSIEICWKLSSFNILRFAVFHCYHLFLCLKLAQNVADWNSNNKRVFSVGQEFGSDLAGWFSLESFMKLQ